MCPPFCSAECRGHAQYLAFAPNALSLFQTLQNWQLSSLVFWYLLVQSLPQPWMHVVIFSPMQFWGLCVCVCVCVCVHFVPWGELHPGAGSAALPPRVPGPSLSSLLGRWPRAGTEKAGPAWRWGSREQEGRRCTIETQKGHRLWAVSVERWCFKRDKEQSILTHIPSGGLFFLFWLSTRANPSTMCSLLFRSSTVELLGGTLGHPAQAPGLAW